MKAKVVFLSIFVPFVILSFCGVYSYANETDLIISLDASRAVLENMNIQIESLPEDLTNEQYAEIIANVLATKGIDNFQGVAPDQIITIGEMEDVFYKVNDVAAADGIENTISKDNLPEELANIFDNAQNTDLSLNDLQIIISYFPAFNETVEAYQPPASPMEVPGGAMIIPEEPATPIF